MPHDARAVANHYIRRGVEAKRPFTQLQILKLVYYSHAWMLAIHDRPLIYQRVEAWTLGPVVADVYHALKHHGWRPIDDYIQGVPEANFDEAETDILEQVFDAYGKFSGMYLSVLTHAVGSPWHRVWESAARPKLISNDIIREHYRAAAAAA